MAEHKARAKTKAPRRRGLNSFDHSLLPEVIRQHYGHRIGEVPSAVLLAAWSWYDRGRHDGMAAGAPGASAKGRSTPAPAAGASPPGVLPGEPWKPLHKPLPRGQGEKMVKSDGPADPVGDEMDAFVDPAAAEAPVVEGEIPAKFAAIGHYDSDTVAAVVMQAEAMAKNPVMGAKVARDLLANSEPYCLELPSGIVCQIDSRLRNLNALRGEDWSKAVAADG